jgi:hypothetical protein
MYYAFFAVQFMRGKEPGEKMNPVPIFALGLALPHIPTSC